MFVWHSLFSFVSASSNANHGVGGDDPDDASSHDGNDDQQEEEEHVLISRKNKASNAKRWRMSCAVNQKKKQNLWMRYPNQGQHRSTQSASLPHSQKTFAMLVWRSLVLPNFQYAAVSSHSRNRSIWIISKPSLVSDMASQLITFIRLRPLVYTN